MNLQKCWSRIQNDHIKTAKGSEIILKKKLKAMKKCISCGRRRAQLQKREQLSLHFLPLCKKISGALLPQWGRSMATVSETIWLKDSQHLKQEG